MPQNVYENSGNFLEFFKSLSISGLEGCLLLPTDDLTVAYISKNKEELENLFLTSVPKWSIIEKCYDKKSTYRLAECIGLPVPQSHFPESISDLAEINYQCNYPIILKPAIMHEFYKKTRTKVFIIHNHYELKDKYIKALNYIKQSDIIIQEIIQGPTDNLFSFGSFFKDKKPIAYIMGQRCRQIPMDFGKASTFVKLCNIPELYELSTKLLSSIGYYGLSEVEFKKDSRDNKYKLLEINPRSWKWHSIALRSGINLPYMLYNDICGAPLEIPFCKAQNSIKWIDFYTDLYISISEIIGGRLSIDEYLRSLKGTRTFSVLSQDDPIPFIVETLLLVKFWRERA